MTPPTVTVANGSDSVFVELRGDSTLLTKDEAYTLYLALRECLPELVQPLRDLRE